MAMDILLVNPVFLNLDAAERQNMSPYFPLGLLYLAAFLRDGGFSVQVFDGTFLEGPGDFAAALAAHQPQFVGISALQPNRQMALKLAQMAKDSGAQVIVGGPDPTYTPESYLASTAVDYVVHHEGEITLVELLNQLLHSQEAPALDDMQGIAYRNSKGEMVVNPRRAYILNLDELPFPARDMIDMQQYLDTWRQHHGYASVTISVARGCPYGCRWCADAVHGQEFRQRSPESVVAEVKSLLDTYEIDRLRVVDDVDGIEREWIVNWAETARAQGAAIPFEALYEVKRKELPLLDLRDSL